MNGIHTITPPEGAAWRYQLDCMLAVLDKVPNIGDDQDAQDMIVALRTARGAAVKIENRIPPEPPSVMALANKPKDPAPTSERKGVSLARR